MIPVIWLVLTFVGPLGSIATSQIPEPNLNACQAIAAELRQQQTVQAALCVPGVR